MTFLTGDRPTEEGRGLENDGGGGRNERLGVEIEMALKHVMLRRLGTVLAFVRGPVLRSFDLKRLRTGPEVYSMMLVKGIYMSIFLSIKFP